VDALLDDAQAPSPLRPSPREDSDDDDAPLWH